MSPEEDGIPNSAWALPATLGSAFFWLSSDVSIFWHGSPTFLLACLGTLSPLALVLSTHLAFCIPSQMGLSQNLPVGHAKAPAVVSPHLQGFAQLQLLVSSVVPLESASDLPVSVWFSGT